MKEIIGFSNYTLSEDGKVYSRFVKGGCGRVSDSLRELKLVLDGTGYFIVSLISDEGIKVKVSVHRLVAMAYLPNPEGKQHVNHINGIKTDNRLCNLEWATPLENTRHAIRTGLKDVRQRSQWTAVQQMHEGEVIQEFESLSEAQRITGIAYPNIVKVCKGLRKKAGGFGWRYSQTSETIPEGSRAVS
jgi:hypothetical protein